MGHIHQHNHGAVLPFRETDLAELFAFKASERKDDPNRRDDLYGPYEILTLHKTGRLPNGYYDGHPPTPWGLRVEESRSNIIWQITMGILDSQPDFATAYLSLSLDTSLKGDDYAHELNKIHREFRKFLETKNHHHDHHHSATDIYNSVSCTACSVLTALAIRNDAMKLVFTEMAQLPVGPDRKAFLTERGLWSFMRVTIEDVMPQPSHVVK